MKSYRPVSLPLAASIAVVLSLSLTGCGGDSKTSAQFVPSATAPAPGLVKMEPKSASGSRIVVDVLIYGPEPDLDLNTFEFGIDIGNTDLVRFVPQATYLQTALEAAEGQEIAIDVDGSDPSTVAIVVQKQGGGAGNGVAADSAIVIELAFDVQGNGTTSVALVGLGANEPQALDSAGTPIGAVRFDAEKAGVSVQTSDGGY